MLAPLLSTSGDSARAQHLLSRVHEEITEGRDTYPLQQATAALKLLSDGGEDKPLFLSSCSVDDLFSRSPIYCPVSLSSKESYLFALSMARASSSCARAA
ncbi:MAG: hypothetical protein ACI9DC_000611 [Gammaproteobacteria bacterium]|jgi:hypothetical protein